MVCEKRPKADEWTAEDYLAVQWNFSDYLEVQMNRFSNYVSERLFGPVFKAIDTAAEFADYLVGGLAEFRENYSMQAKRTRPKRL